MFQPEIGTRVDLRWLGRHDSVLGHQATLCTSTHIGRTHVWRWSRHQWEWERGILFTFENSRSLYSPTTVPLSRDKYKKKEKERNMVFDNTILVLNYPRRSTRFLRYRIIFVTLFRLYNRNDRSDLASRASNTHTWPTCT